MASYYPTDGNRPARKRESITQSESTSAKSESSKSSFVGPTVISTEFYASTRPVPQHPFQHLPISKADAAKWPKFCQQTADLLRKWNFDFQTVDILNVKHTNGTSLQPRLKIGVSSTKDRNRWKEIIILLYRSLFQDAGFPHFGLDVERPNPNSIFVVEPGHPFIATWSGLRDKVVQLLQSYEWRALDVLLYGETVKKAKPTVFITMEERPDDGWLELQQKIRGVVGDYAEVEKRGGKVQEITTRINDTTPTGSPPHQAYANQIHGGWGIGVDDSSTGTLGGFVKLCDEYGRKRVYGLTNYHVVRPEMPDFPAGIDRGLKQIPWPRKFSYVCSPSEEDFVEEKEFVERELNGDRITSRLYPPSLWRRLHMGETLTDDERQPLEYLRNRIDLLESRYALLNGLTGDDRRLGKVAYFAGFRVEDDFRLDWALVEVEQGRIGLNRLPISEEVPSGFHLQGDRVRKINKTLEIGASPGLYFKIGRTTGLTIGKFSGIESEINLDVPLNDEDGGEQKRKMKSQAHVLVASQGVDRPFTQGGDSGAWVCDRFGSLVGLAWGNSAFDTTYCTPIGRILADIEARTGMKVELP